MADSSEQIRLVYRPFDERDIALCYAWAQNEAVVRYLPSMPRPLTWEQHGQWAKAALQRSGRVDFMIRDGSGEGFRSSDGWVVPRVLGRVHATNLTWATPEVGVLIGDMDMWGKGVATEAVGWMVHWLHEHGPWIQCFALIHPENIASIAAFEKNGFVRRRDEGKLLVRGRGGQLVFDKQIRP